MKKRIIEVAVKVVVAALTAFLTAITTTSCMGYGPIALYRKGPASRGVGPFSKQLGTLILRSDKIYQ